MSSVPRILCVDDHEVLAAGLEARLQREPHLAFAGHLATAQGLVREVQRLEASIVLLDIDMPGPDPFEALQDLSRRLPEARAIVLTAHVREPYFEAATDAGAWGYLSKSDPPAAIVAGIRDVVAGRFAMSPEVESRCAAGGKRGSAAGGRLGTLSPREQEILRLTGRGMVRAEIARMIHRSLKTVDAHQSSIMRKLGVHGRVNLVLYAVRKGLVEP